MKCARQGCEALATVMPVALLWPPGAARDAEPAMTLIRLRVCEAHGREDFSDPARLPKIMKGFKELVERGLAKEGKCAPDWTRTRVELLPVAEAEKCFMRPENN